MSGPLSCHRCACVPSYLEGGESAGNWAGRVKLLRADDSVRKQHDEGRTREAEDVARPTGKGL